MDHSIDTNSRLNQVKKYLLNYIKINQIDGQTPLPSESTLAKTLGISRNTLREAYVELEHDGVIIRRHGIGTFVSNSHFISDSLNDFSPFTKIIDDSGFTPHFKTISTGMIAPPNEVTDLFGLKPHQRVFMVKRLVLADDQPVIYIEDFMHPKSELEKMNWEAFDGNLVRFLAASLKTSLHHIQSKIRALDLPAEYSKHMNLDSGTPVLDVRSIIYKEDNQPVVFSHICFNSNFVELNITRMIHND